jgi:putative PIN family toxin of toxin-antitoxin system
VKIILDTNVFVSGIFFSGPPYQILQAWRAGQITIVLSPEIFDEYQRVAGILAEQFPPIDLSALLNIVKNEAEFYDAPALPEPVCTDPNDDKFLACALAAKVTIIVSGDKHLLQVSGFQRIKSIKPREFVDKYLGRK